MDDMIAGKASHRYARISPRKARYVADMVRGMQVAEALNTLHFTPRKAAQMISKIIDSALANASQDKSVDVDSLIIKRINVDGGPTLKRWRPRARGMATRIRKRTSHITVELAEV